MTATEMPAGPLSPTPANIADARAYLLGAWKERAEQMHHDVPHDLSGACIFAAAFSLRLFGGTVRGGWHHVYVDVDGTRVCLTAAEGVDLITRQWLELADQHGPGVLSPFFQGADPDPYLHQPEFFDTPDWQDTWESVQPRAEGWAQDFLARR